MSRNVPMDSKSLLSVRTASYNALHRKFPDTESAIEWLCEAFASADEWRREESERMNRIERRLAALEEKLKHER